MKRVLFGVDSYFQLIIAVNLKTTIYKDDKADLILYGSVPSAEVVHGRLNDCGLYENVWLAQTSLTRCGKNYTKWQKLPKYFVYLRSLISPSSTLRNIIGDSLDYKYDEFLFNGFGALPETIFNVAVKKNPQIVCKRFEDGYVSYFTVYGSKKGKMRRGLEKTVELLFGNKNIDKYVKEIYFQEPDLVIGEMPYPIVGTPKFNRSNKPLVNALNYVFNYTEDDFVNTKDIFLFEDGSLYFAQNEEEVDIVSTIADNVDKSRITVKMHPRRNEFRFSHLGVDRFPSSSLPWEIIQLNNNFTGKVFITAASSIAFSSDIYFGDKCHKILFFRCMKTPPPTIDSRFEKYLNAYLKKYGNDSVIIPNSYNELINYIKTI